MIRYFFLFTILFFLSACQKPLDERIADETREWTETNCPKTIDAITRLDSMTYHIPSQTVQYWYTASGEADNATYWALVDAKKEIVRHQFGQQLRVNTEIKELVANKRNFEYIYHSATTGNKLYSIAVTSKDYE